MEFVTISTVILWSKHDMKKLTVIIQFFLKKRNFTNQNNFIDEGTSSLGKIFSKIKSKNFYDARGKTDCLIDWLIDSFIHSFIGWLISNVLRIFKHSVYVVPNRTWLHAS